MNLVVIAVHQQRFALAADKLDGVVARVEDRRHLEHAADEWRGNEFEAETSVRSHGCFPCAQAGALQCLSVAGRLARRPQPVMP
jgi:hypothetical protein